MTDTPAAKPAAEHELEVDDFNDVCLLPPYQDLPSDEGARAAARIGLTWKRKSWSGAVEITVGFIGGSQPLRDAVQKYVQLWETYANVQFVFQRRPKKIRVAFNTGHGSWSYVGRQALNVTSQDWATMNLDITERTAKTRVKRLVLHEFGHALGLVHALSCPAAPDIDWDKEAVYKDYAERGWSREMVDRSIFAKYSARGPFVAYTELDRASIMIYLIPKEHLRGSGTHISLNTKLSKTDSKAIRTLYPWPSQYITQFQCNYQFHFSGSGPIPWVVNIRSGRPTDGNLKAWNVGGGFSVTCTCPLVNNSEKPHFPCKHMAYAIGPVLGISDIHEESTTLDSLLGNGPITRLKRRDHGVSHVCPVCFLECSSESGRIRCSNACSHIAHEECLKKWREARRSQGSQPERCVLAEG